MQGLELKELPNSGYVSEPVKIVFHTWLMSGKVVWLFNSRSVKDYEIVKHNQYGLILVKIHYFSRFPRYSLRRTFMILIKTSYFFFNDFQFHYYVWSF